MHFGQMFLYLLPKYRNMWPNENTELYEVNSFSIHGHNYKKENIPLTSLEDDLPTFPIDEGLLVKKHD